MEVAQVENTLNYTAVMSEALAKTISGRGAHVAGWDESRRMPTISGMRRKRNYSGGHSSILREAGIADVGESK